MNKLMKHIYTNILKYTYTQHYVYGNKLSSNYSYDAFSIYHALSGIGLQEHLNNLSKNNER